MFDAGTGGALDRNKRTSCDPEARVCGAREAFHPGQDGWRLASLFYLAFLLISTSSRSIKIAKKRTRPISSHLNRTSLVNEGFIR